MDSLGKIYLGNTLVSSGDGGGGGDDKRIVFIIQTYWLYNGQISYEAPAYYYLERDAETGYYRIFLSYDNTKAKFIAEDILYAVRATTPPATPGAYYDTLVYGLVNPIAALGNRYVVKNKVGTVTISADESGYADLTGLETGDAIFL